MLIGITKVDDGLDAQAANRSKCSTDAWGKPTTEIRTLRYAIAVNRSWYHAFSLACWWRTGIANLLPTTYSPLAREPGR